MCLWFAKPVQLLWRGFDAGLKVSRAVYTSVDNVLSLSPDSDKLHHEERTDDKDTARRRAPGGRDRRGCKLCQDRDHKCEIEGCAQPARCEGGLMVAAPISDAVSVADEILKIAKRRGKLLTPMQLVKLTYIAHGWALAVLERDLFADRIEAWKYGPVIPRLYHATKQYGRSEIPLHLIDDQAPPRFDADVTEFLEDVVEKYGDLTGFALSNLTHREGTPWHQVYEDGVMNIEIDDARIANHYRAKLNEYRGSAA